MVNRKKIVITNNKEIYEKLIKLNFIDEVILKTSKKYQINKILNNINKNGKILIKEKIGDYILLKKISPLNYNVYLTK